MGMSSGHCLPWDRLAHENIQVQGGEVVCSRSATEPASFWCSRLWPGDGTVSLSCWKLARFSHNHRARRGGFSSTPARRAPPRSQTWVSYHTHNYLVMFSWTATLFIPSSSEVPQGKSPDDKTHTIAAFCCTPNTTYHPSPFSLSVEYQLLSEFKLCCTHRCPCPLYMTEGRRLSFSIYITPKLPIVFCFFPLSWYSWQTSFCNHRVLLDGHERTSLEGAWWQRLLGDSRYWATGCCRR